MSKEHCKQCPRSTARWHCPTVTHQWPETLGLQCGSDIAHPIGWIMSKVLNFQIPPVRIGSTEKHRGRCSGDLSLDRAPAARRRFLGDAVQSCRMERRVLDRKIRFKQLYHFCTINRMVQRISHKYHEKSSQF